MKNFAAQQLSKKQMNDVKGGSPEITVYQLQYCEFYKDGNYVGCNYIIGSLNQMLKEAAANKMVVRCTTNFE